MSAWGGKSLKSCDALLRRAEQNDSRLKELYVLPTKNFTDEDALRLARALENGRNTHLRRISASGHALDPATLSQLANAIATSSFQLTFNTNSNDRETKQNTSEIETCNPTSKGIISLAIGHQGMGNEGVVALCQGVQAALSSCHSSFESNGDPPPLQWQELDLAFKNLSSEGFAAVGRCFGGRTLLLETLDLSRNEAAGDEAVSALCNASIESMTESCNRHSNSDKKLPFATLTSLNLSQCSVGASGVRALAFCLAYGTTPDLESNNIPDNEEKTTALSRSRPPLTLDLRQNSKLGADGVASLRPLLSFPLFSSNLTPKTISLITNLNLSYCLIGDDGVQALQNAACLDGLQVLDLAHNGIGHDGAKILASMFSPSPSEDGERSDCALPTLKELHLGHNPLGEDGVVALASSLCTFKGAQQNQELTTTSGKNHVLSLVDLTHTSCGSKGACTALRASKLTTLRLFDNALGSSVAPHVSGFQAMTQILQEEEASQDQSSSALVTLDVGGNRASDQDVAFFLHALASSESALPYLKVLELGGNDMGVLAEEALKKLQHARPNLDVARGRPKTS